MTAPDTHPPRRTRRGRRSARGHLCTRESCNRYCRGEHTYCSSVCRVWADELNHLEKHIREAGSGKVAGEAWAIAVQINDLLTEHHTRKSLLRSILKRHNESNETSNAETSTQSESEPVEPQAESEHQ
jgi:hypothetical protein